MADTQQPEKKEEVEAKVEDVDDIPALEAVNDDSALTGNLKRQNKSEKKVRKALQKLGLKPVPGITKVSVRKGKQNIFYITQPEVFKSPSSETYIIFGIAKEDDLASQLPLQLTKDMESALRGEEEEGGKVEAGEKPAEEKEGEEEESAEGLDPKDIELVMQQGKVSRAAAIRALRKTNGDMVAAIMELTLQK